jgi:hypothetical protein
MAQIEQNRQERIALQRQADNDNAYASQRALSLVSEREEKIALQRQEDNDEEQEREADEAEEEAKVSELMLRGLHLRKQRVLEAEGKLVTAVNEKANLWNYKFAFSAAILKDLLDLVGFSLPVISFIVTFLFSVVIFIALYFAKTNKGVLEIRYFVQKFVVWTGGFITESLLFGINFLPIQTLVVYLIYLIDKSASNEQIEKAVEFLNTIKKARF